MGSGVLKNIIRYIKMSLERSLENIRPSTGFTLFQSRVCSSTLFDNRTDCMWSLKPIFAQWPFLSLSVGRVHFLFKGCPVNIFIFILF